MISLLFLGITIIQFAQAKPLSTLCNFSGALQGSVVVIEHNGASRFSGRIWPLTRGRHGFHIHENGNLSDHCDAAGGHFDPPGSNHTRHVGDLGNIEAEEYPGIEEGGVATFEFEDSLALLRGPHSIL